MSNLNNVKDESSAGTSRGTPRAAWAIQESLSAEDATATRDVPGVGRLTVADDHPELVALLNRSTRDTFTIDVLSDWLYDRGDARADLVTDLTVVDVVVNVPPELLTMAILVAGQEWGAVRRPGSVRAWAYPGTRLYAALHAANGWSRCKDDSPHVKQVRSSRACPLDTVMEQFDECRRTLLLRLFGTDSSGVEALASLQSRALFSGVPRLLQSVGPAAGAKWLSELAQTDPQCFEAVLREVRYSHLTRLPEYAEFAAPDAGNKS